jgi:hypothetical protein
MEYTENIISVYSNISPQTQGGRFWKLEFENRKNDLDANEVDGQIKVVQARNAESDD